MALLYDTKKYFKTALFLWGKGKKKKKKKKEKELSYFNCSHLGRRNATDPKKPKYAAATAKPFVLKRKRRSEKKENKKQQQHYTTRAHFAKSAAKSTVALM
jgi:hypothetical protein